MLKKKLEIRFRERDRQDSHLGGRDARGRALKALLSSEISSAEHAEVVLSGLDAGAAWAWSVEAVNDSVSKLEPLAGGVQRPDASGALRLAFPLRAPVVALLRVGRSI